MRKLATQDIAEDLGITMRMCREAGSGSDSIFIQDAKTTEVLESTIKVSSKTESVIRVQPSMIRMSTIRRTAKDDLGMGKRLGHFVVGSVRYVQWVNFSICSDK